jgi:GDP-mannose 6-dehydrogenase
LPSNALQIQRAVDLIASQGKRKIGILGLSFKAGTDDLRMSPLISLAEALLRRGYEVRIYEPDISLARLAGVDNEPTEKETACVSRCLCRSFERIMNFSEILIVGNSNPEFAKLLAMRRPDQMVIDLVRLLPNDGAIQPNYEGICW